MRITQRQRHLLEAVNNCIGGFPIKCMAAHSRQRTRALQKRGLIRKHKTLAILTKAGHTAISLQQQRGSND